jgi:hypothetical protein
MEHNYQNPHQLNFVTRSFILFFYVLFTKFVCINQKNQIDFSFKFFVCSIQKSI